jgi:hypothetical protein
MAALYRARFQGRSTAQAVHDAHAALIADLRRQSGAAPPSAWAAFVAAGDWR